MDDGRRELLWLVIALYAISLALPAVSLPNGEGHGPIGLMFLVFGAFGFTVDDYRWIANILLFAGLILDEGWRRSPIAARVCLVSGVVVAASCIFVPPTFLGVEGGNLRPVTAPLWLGGYAWVLAMVAACLRSFHEFSPADRTALVYESARQRLTRPIGVDSYRIKYGLDAERLARYIEAGHLQSHEGLYVEDRPPPAMRLPSREARKTLNRPLHVAVYCERYGVDEDAVKAALNQGDLAGYRDPHDLYVEDAPIRRGSEPAR